MADRSRRSATSCRCLLGDGCVHRCDRRFHRRHPRLVLDERSTAAGRARERRAAGRGNDAGLEHGHPRRCVPRARPGRRLRGSVGLQGRVAACVPRSVDQCGCGRRRAASRPACARARYELPQPVLHENVSVRSRPGRVRRPASSSVPPAKQRRRSSVCGPIAPVVPVRTAAKLRVGLRPSFRCAPQRSFAWGFDLSSRLSLP